MVTRFKWESTPYSCSWLLVPCMLSCTTMMGYIYVYIGSSTSMHYTLQVTVKLSIGPVCFIPGSGPFYCCFHKLYTKFV